MDSYSFLSMGLNEKVKKLDNDDFNILKKEFTAKWQNLNKKVAHPYEYFNCLDDFKKPVDTLKKEEFFRKLKKQMS